MPSPSTTEPAQSSAKHAAGTAPSVGLAMSALIMAVLLAALDQTIVSTALPAIASDVGGFEYIAWVSASYLLATTASTPLWGKLGDMFGRKRLYLGAMAMFLVASGLCGLAQDMSQLVAARSLQGLGGGGMLVLTFALVGDVAGPADRSRYQGMFGGVYGVASILGPVLGGVFTDQLSWRWAFLINLPIGLVGLLLASRNLPAGAKHRTGPIDYLGAMILAALSVCLVLIVSFGDDWGWSSVRTIALAAAAVVLLLVLLPAERRAPEPVLPLPMLRTPTVSIASLVGFIANFAMFCVLVYLPTYLQVVHGVSATLSGLHMLPLVLGLVISQALAGRWSGRTGKWQLCLVAGMALNIVGLLLLATLSAHTSAWVLGLYFAVVGVGIGMVPMVVMAAVQNAVDPADLGAASAMVTYSRSMGAAFGVAAFGAVFNHVFTPRLTSALNHSDLPAEFDPTKTDAIASLPSAVKIPVLEAFSDTVASTFLLTVPLLVLGFVLTLFLATRRSAATVARR